MKYKCTRCGNEREGMAQVFPCRRGLKHDWQPIAEPAKDVPIGEGAYNFTSTTVNKMTPIEQLAEAIEALDDDWCVEATVTGTRDPYDDGVILDTATLKALVAEWRKMKTEREQNNAQYKFVPLA